MKLAFVIILAIWVILAFLFLWALARAAKKPMPTISRQAPDHSSVNPISDKEIQPTQDQSKTAQPATPPHASSF